MRFARPDVAVAAIAIAAAVLTICLSGASTVPGVFPDEMCFLGWARFLAGGEFYRMGAAAFCHPAYPGLLALAQALMPGGSYTPAIVLNGLFVGGCCCVAAIVARRHLGATPWQAWAISVVVALYPPLIGYTGFAWPEPMLYLLALVLFWCWCRWVEQPGVTRLGLIVCCVAALFLVHPRMIGVLALFAACLAVAWVRAPRSASRTPLLAFLLICIGSVAFMAQMKAHFLPAAWQYDVLSSAERIPESFATRGSSIFGKLGGQLAFASISTLGLAWVPFGIVFGRAHPAGPSRESRLKHALPVAGLLATALVGAVFLAPSDRIDTYFYGRYVGPFVLLALVAGMASCGRVRRFPWQAIAAMLALVGIGIVLQPALDPTSDFSRIHIVGITPLADWLASSTGQWAMAWLAGSVAAATIAGSILARLPTGAAAVVMVAGFLALHVAGESVPIRHRTLPSQPELQAWLGAGTCRVYWSGEIAGRVQNHQAYRLQFGYPGCRFEFLEANRCDLGPGSVLVLDAASDRCREEAGQVIPMAPGLKALVLR